YSNSCTSCNFAAVTITLLSSIWFSDSYQDSLPKLKNPQAMSDTQESHHLITNCVFPLLHEIFNYYNTFMKLLSKTQEPESQEKLLHDPDVGSITNFLKSKRFGIRRPNFGCYFRK